MRVILEVMSGPNSGRKSVLGAFQNVQIGRTERADFAIPADGRLSSVHFALETDANSCYLKDLGSRNGTFLNGQPLADRAALRQNDEIAAGDTIFRIHIESESADLPHDLSHRGEPPAASDFATTPAVAVPSPVPRETPKAAEPRSSKRGKVVYAFEACGSGLSLCTGSVADIRPTDLANLLSLKTPLYLILDPRKITVGQISNLSETPENPDIDRSANPPHNHKPSLPPAAIDYLFNWIPPETAELASPIVISASQFNDWPTLIEQGWGNDALVCLFSHYDKPSLLEHLRHCLRAKPKQTELSAGIVGYCWPGVMSMLLAHGMHNFVGNFFTGIDAVLIELPDLPECWQFYGPPSATKMIDDLGFVRKEPGMAVST